MEEQQPAQEEEEQLEQIPNRYHDDQGESLLTLTLNNQNYLTSPLFGKTYLLCCCCQRFDFPSDVKQFIQSFKKHLKTWNCFDFEEIKDYVEEYLKLVEEQRQSNDYWSPLSLDTVFEIPAHISIMAGTLCRFCHQLRSEKIKSRCCEEMMRLKVRVYASNDSRRRMNLVLHSIVDNSLAVKDYLDKAYSRKQFRNRITELENHIISLKNENSMLAHENKLFRESHNATGTLGNLAHGVVELPSEEWFLENLVSARSLYNEVPNPNLVLTKSEFIRKILNFPRNISNEELFILHQSFRGSSHHQEKALASVSLALMQIMNDAIDKVKGPIASHITSLCLGSKGEAFHGRAFASITSQSVRKYNQVFTRPFLVFLYRSDESFKQDVDVIHSFYLSESNEDDRKLHFARMLRIVLMHLTRLLQDHSLRNATFNFLQAACVIAKKDQTTTRDLNGNDTNGDILIGGENDVEVKEIEIEATSTANITICKPSTLIVLLSAVRYFCFGTVLISWKGLVPIDNHLQVFRAGMIFHQIASLSHQLQSRKEQIQEEADVLKQKLLDLEKKLVDSENELELSVLCQVCLERRKDTVLLNCGHTFCSICITDIMKNHEKNCPQCRQAIHEAAKMFF